MPTILLLTCDPIPHYDVETVLVAQALERRGVDSITLPWDSAELGRTPADLAVIRSTWDYTVRLPEFLLTLDRLPMPVANPIPVVRWNSHKSYLLDLRKSGIPVLPTDLVPAGSIPDAPHADAAEVVIKPAVSAGSRGLGRFPSGSPEAADHLAALLTSGDALVQPFLPGVMDGERSLVFLGGVYSHAVHKQPAADDFRVQQHLGGSNRPHIASGAELELARAALEAVPGGADGLLYARVDLIGSAAGPLVMELELIEPELFLPHAPDSAQRLADAAIALL